MFLQTRCLVLTGRSLVFPAAESVRAHGKQQLASRCLLARCFTARSRHIIARKTKDSRLLMFLHTRDKMYANRCDKLQNPTSAHVVSLDVAALKAVKHQRLVGDAKKRLLFVVLSNG